ncbi:hypothetical protein IWX64_001490 [Arthrobacter sp. CAN_A212]
MLLSYDGEAELDQGILLILEGLQKQLDTRG